MTYKTEEEREAARRRSETKRREREGYKKSAIAVAMMRSLGSMPPPIEVLLEREQRLNAPGSDHPNCIVLGDPWTRRWDSNAAHQTGGCQ